MEGDGAACWVGGAREDDCAGEWDGGGMPWVVSRERISGFGRSKPRALRATLNSW